MAVDELAYGAVRETEGVFPLEIPPFPYPLALQANSHDSPQQLTVNLTVKG